LNKRKAAAREATQTTTPGYPDRIMVEISNTCNHGCLFCAYRTMRRAKGYLDFDLYRRIIQEAYELGAREIGLHSGAEPFANPELHRYVEAAKAIGYTYVYFSTNGSIPGEERLAQVIDAGLDSIKFSVNAGDRETYKAIHGHDHFDKVLHNIRFVDQYRKRKGLALYLCVSFVEVEENASTFQTLEDALVGVVDEVVKYQAVNQSGQVANYPSRSEITSVVDGGDFYSFRESACFFPFTTFYVSREGYLRACCNDYNNMVAVEDLNTMSLKDAWHSARFIELRERLLAHKVAGLLCQRCLYGGQAPYSGFNPELAVDIEEGR
jgi:pyruvate-formate lyase-activating enzyme